jgi:undecaprenyl-diphosphatase
MKNIKAKRWQIIILVAGLIGLYLLLPKVKQLKGTFTIIEHTDYWWILLGLVLTLLVFMAASFTQFSAGNFTGKIKKIFTISVEGNFFNSILPVSLGSMGLFTAYYKKLGNKSPTAVTIATIPIIFGFITSCLLLIVISPAAITHIIRYMHNSPDKKWILIGFILLVLLIIFGLIFYRNKIRDFFQEGKKALRSIRNVRAIPSLFIGSLLITLFSSLILFVSVLGVSSSISITDAIAVYIVASTVGGMMPTPGGIGGIEAALVLGLTSSGLNVTHAVAATILYRFISFWLPMLPGSFIAYRHKNLAQ